MKILSLNGGGTSGYISLYILNKIEQAFNNEYKPYQLFDMIAGVSIGSIIGAMLVKGCSAKESLDMYKEVAPKIFKKKRCAIMTLFMSKYKNTELVDFAKNNLDFDIKNSKTKFLCYAVDINNNPITPKFWKSWRDSIKAYDAVLASSAAPTYFDPHVIDQKYYIDGSLATNNPSMCAIADALRYGATLENLYNLNIACGTLHGYQNPKKMVGIVKWIADITGVATYAGTGTEEYQAHSLIGFRNHCIKPDIYLSLESLDFGAMEESAEKAWSLHGNTIIENLSPDK